MRIPTANLFDRMAKEGVDFELKCTRCGKVGKHKVRRLMINPDAGARPDVFLGRIIHCAKCGAEDEYELTGKARLTVITAALALDSSKAPQHIDDPVVFGAPALKDGFRYRRPSEAVRHMREKLEKDPGDVDGWVRLGNFLRRHDEREKAFEAYLKAETLDASNLDALVNLMTFMAEQDRLEKSWDYLRRAVEALPKGAPETRRLVVPLLSSHLQAAAKGVDGPMWLHAVWMGDVNARKAGMATMSAVDLTRLRRWDRLEEFLKEPGLEVLVFTKDGPMDRPTILEKKLERSGVRGKPDPVIFDFGRDGLIPTGVPSRNAPCPCGSGLKFKKCCGK